jgi:hypothetical protein
VNDSGYRKKKVSGILESPPLQSNSATPVWSVAKDPVWSVAKDRHIVKYLEGRSR